MILDALPFYEIRKWKGKLWEKQHSHMTIHNSSLKELKERKWITIHDSSPWGIVSTLLKMESSHPPAGLRLGGSPPDHSKSGQTGNMVIRPLALSLSPSSVFPSLTCLLSGHYHPTIMVGGTFGAETSQAKVHLLAVYCHCCDINCISKFCSCTVVEKRPI